MDERALFDRFHEALDVEPRPGAYERLRTQITSQPVALRRAPVFRMRFSKMGLRMAAALVAVLIAVALVATFIAVHNRPVGEIPAGHDQNVTTYRAMIVRDYKAMDASTSNHCNTIQDTGCADATVPVIAALQKWVDDMQAFPNTPTQYRALALALGAHLKDVIADLNGAVGFQKAGNEAGFNLVMKHGVFERAWIDPATYTIEGTYPILASSFRDALARAKYSVSGCLGTTPGPTDVACNRLINYETCPDAKALGCEDDVETVETQIQAFLVGMAQNPAPSAQASDYAKLQADLVRADAGALAVHDAIPSVATTNNIIVAETALLNALESASRDLVTI